MFSIPRPNVIESEKGYSVEVLGRTGLRYTDGGRVLHIDSEVLAGPSGIIIYSQSINTEKDKAKIIENIQAAFKFRGFDIQVV